MRFYNAVTCVSLKYTRGTRPATKVSADGVAFQAFQTFAFAEVTA